MQCLLLLRGMGGGGECKDQTARNMSGTPQKDRILLQPVLNSHDHKRWGELTHDERAPQLPVHAIMAMRTKKICMIQWKITA